MIDERKSQIVELRFFGGLTVEEVAEVMKLSPITIKREWRAAKPGCIAKSTSTTLCLIFRLTLLT